MSFTWLFLGFALQFRGEEMGGGTEETKLAKRDCGILGKEVNSAIQLSRLTEKKKSSVWKKSCFFFFLKKKSSQSTLEAKTGGSVNS